MNINELLTVRVMTEIIEHEAIVPEAYKDSVGVWTWSVGITSASGHDVERYIDNPQPIGRCLEVYEWLLRTKYAPDVIKAFGELELKENEFCAALSFHWNTGRIRSAEWVKSVRAGNAAAARRQIMNFRKPVSLTKRREAERDLLFAGEWHGNGFSTVYPVRKPSYTPDWGKARKVDVRPELERIIQQRDKESGNA